MKKRLISLLLAGALALSAMLMLAGCGDSDYPVSVANIVIDSEPESIVVLDPAAADIIDYIGYSAKLVGRSDEVNQEWLSVAPSVGSAAEPDVNAIISSEADVVFATEELSDSAKQSLAEAGITVVTVAETLTQAQIETNYISIGKILGGEEAGALKAERAYEKLIESMTEIKAAVDDARVSDIPYEVCYLYTDDNELKMMTSGTYGDMLLSYTSAVNVAVNVSDNTVEVSTLKVANPEFLFYDSEETLARINSDDTLKSLNAVKNKKLLMITSEQMSRQGTTALETLQTMVEFMYPELADSSDSKAATDTTVAASATAKTETTAPNDSSVAATEAVKSVADDYGIELEKLSLKYEDENDNIKAMQQRLFDLGYIDNDENVTGYYGDVSKAAVQEFQKNSGIKATGTADNATLVAMFAENAVKADVTAATEAATEAEE